MFSKARIGIDLGTANILVYSSKGIILNEPSVVAIDTKTNKVIATGTDAWHMIGRTPKHIRSIRPLQAGVIADYEITAQLIEDLLKKASRQTKTSIRKPSVVICTSSGSTDVERRAIHNAVMSYGAKQVHLIEEPIAAAIGAELPVEDPIASAILDIGGGTSEVAIISLGGVVSSSALRVGGDNIDEDIIQYIKKKYNTLIGQRTAIEAKINLGNAQPEHVVETMEIRGRDLVTGLPKTMEISSKEIYTAMKPSLEKILTVIETTLEKSPPELSGDIFDHGMVLTGGGALLRGIDSWLETELGIPVRIAPNPLESVAIGTGESLKILDKLNKIKV